MNMMETMTEREYNRLAEALKTCKKHRSVKLTSFWKWCLKYYESMKKEFPDEPIWDRGIEDTKRLLRGSASLEQTE